MGAIKWHKHDGWKCPVAPGVPVYQKFADGDVIATRGCSCQPPMCGWNNEVIHMFLGLPPIVAWRVPSIDDEASDFTVEELTKPKEKIA